MQLKIYMIIRVRDGKVMLATLSKPKRDDAFNLQQTECIKVDLDVNEWIAL